MFTAQEMGYQQPTQEMLEQENDRQEELLSGKVKALKSVSILSAWASDQSLCCSHEEINKAI